MLHTVNKSPFEKNTLDSCLRYAAKGSAVLLIEDGVYGALKDTQMSTKVLEAMQKVSVYALQPDLEARAMLDRTMDGIELVDYAGFVDLVTAHNTVQAWL